MKMTVMLCAAIFLCLLHLSSSQAAMVSSSPNNQETIPGKVKKFTCTFIGHSVPHWLITMTDGMNETITAGTTTAMFSLPNITEINGAGTVSELSVTPDVSLNGSTYKCQIPAVGGLVESMAATLTVFGKPLPPHAIHIATRYSFVRVGWTTPWSSTFLQITVYKVELLQSNGAIQEQATVSVGSTDNREKTFDNLTPQTQYSARVAAVNNAGQSDWSTPVQFTTPPPDPPPPPVDLMLKVDIAGGTPTVTASWVAPEIDDKFQTDVTSYTIFHKNSKTAFTSVMLLESDRSYIIPDTVLFEIYTVKMTAANTGGDSGATKNVFIAAEYIQTVVASGGLNHMNITCTFASTIDIALKCSVELKGPMTKTVEIDKVTASPTATKMEPDLKAGIYNLTAKAVHDDTGLDASPHTATYNLVTVTEPPTPEPSPSPDPPTDPPPTESTTAGSPSPQPPGGRPAGTSFTTAQIGIIAGVVVGVFVALVMVPCGIFSCFVLCRK